MSATHTTPKKKKRWKRRLVIVIAVLIGLYIVLVNFLVSAALVPSFMTKLSAFDRITEQSLDEQMHSAEISENERLTKAYMEDWKVNTPQRIIEAETADGYTLRASEFYQIRPSHRYVLVLHGYTGSKEEMFPYAAYYYRRNYNAIVPDLRAQGESEGDYIGMGWTDHVDCRLWIDHILSLDPDAEIVIHGQSMGAATALIMTGESDLPDNVKAVISDCSYTDAYSMFGEKCKDWFHLPPFPLVDSACLCLKLRGGYDLKKASALEAVKKSHTPTLFIHGAEDRMIPADMSRELYQAASSEKELLIIPGAGHAQAAPKDSQTYYETISAFLKDRIQ